MNKIELLEQLEMCRVSMVSQCKSKNQADPYHYGQRLADQMDIIYQCMSDIVGSDSELVTEKDTNGNGKRKPGRPRLSVE